ncbi:MAG: phosphoribosyl-AMP cyclohydrolase [Parcubacteria group bacterium]|jgi:phosphoribosyl-AMP cyclohydrolase
METRDYVRKVIKFEKLSRFFQGNPNGIVPVAVQDYLSGKILMIAHADVSAIIYSLENKVAAFWSVSRNEFWIKGNTSGNFLDVVAILVDCEYSSLVYLVNPRTEGVCHKKMRSGKNRKSCFFKTIKMKEGESIVLNAI